MTSDQKQVHCGRLAEASRGDVVSVPRDLDELRRLAAAGSSDAVDVLVELAGEHLARSELVSPARGSRNRLVGILHGCRATRTIYDEVTAQGHHTAAAAA